MKRGYLILVLALTAGCSGSTISPSSSISGASSAATVSNGTDPATEARVGASETRSLCHDLGGTFNMSKTHWTCSAKKNQSFDDAEVSTLLAACSTSNRMLISPVAYGPITAVGCYF